MANQVHKSHKGRQKMANERRGKYKRQLRRSIAKKIKVLEAYLLQHPKDKQNQRDISIAIKKYNVMF
jgi:ribosomal protein S15P/S13E